ncbi:MAG: GC-type dockerin domain-anchored protein [Phycisphaerales bacterium JB058]
MICPADVNADGAVTPTDFSAWVAAFNAMDPIADVNGDGQVTPTDFSAWIQHFNAGC